MFGRYLIVDPKYYFACICILDVQSVLTLLMREGKKKKKIINIPHSQASWYIAEVLKSGERQTQSPIPPAA